MSRLIAIGGKLLAIGGKLITCAGAICCCPSGQSKRTPTITGGFSDVVLDGDPCVAGYGYGNVCRSLWLGVKVKSTLAVADLLYTGDWSDIPPWTDQTFDFVSDCDTDPNNPQTRNRFFATTNRTRCRGRLWIFETKRARVTTSIQNNLLTITVVLKVEFSSIGQYAIAIDIRTYDGFSYVFPSATPGVLTFSNVGGGWGLVAELINPITGVTFANPYAKITTVCNDPDRYVVSWHKQEPQYQGYWSTMQPCLLMESSSGVFPCDLCNCVRLTCVRWDFYSHGTIVGLRSECTYLEAGSSYNITAYRGLIIGDFMDHVSESARCGNIVNRDLPTNLPLNIANPTVEKDISQGGASFPSRSSVIQDSSIQILRRNGTVSNTATTTYTYSASFDPTDFRNGVAKDYVLNRTVDPLDAMSLQGTFKVGNATCPANCAEEAWTYALPTADASITVNI